MSVDQFWHITYPPPADHGGMQAQYQLVAADEVEAHIMGRAKSAQYGHATVANREGLVATYVSGKEWKP